MDAHLAILGHGNSQVLYSSVMESIACQNIACQSVACQSSTVGHYPAAGVSSILLSS